MWQKQVKKNKKLFLNILHAIALLLNELENERQLGVKNFSKTIFLLLLSLSLYFGIFIIVSDC